MKTILEEGTYTIEAVGKTSTVSFPGNDGQQVTLTKYDIKLKDQPQWFELSQKPDAPAPAVNQQITGHGEQDDEGKYPAKFKKPRGGGSWGGGGKSGPGAAWANAVQTAATLISGYYAASGTKPKDFAEFLGKVQLSAPAIKKMVDDFVGAEKPETPATNPSDNKTTSESGESPAPTGEKDIVIDDISEDELKGW